MPRRGKAFLSLSIAFFVCVVTARMSLGSGFIGGATGGLGAVNVTGTPSVGQTVKATSSTTATWQDSGITAPASIPNTANDTSDTLSITKVPPSTEQASGSPVHITTGSRCDGPSILLTGNNVISADAAQDLTFSADNVSGSQLNFGHTSGLRWANNIGANSAQRNFVAGTQVAQNATFGLFYLPRCATGAPTGTPSAVSGAAATVVGGDHHLYSELTSGTLSRIADGNGIGSVIPTDSGFSWLHQSTSTEALATVNGRTYVQLVSPAEAFSHIRSFVTPITATPYAIECGFRPPATAFSGSTDHVVGLVLIDSVSDKQIIMGTYPGGSQFWASEYTNFTTITGSASTSPTFTLIPADMYYMRMEDDGTNMVGKYSVDGITFFQLFSIPRSGHFTATHMGLQVTNNDGTHPVTLTVVHLNYGTGI